jgi:hypothetical protein
MPNVMPEPTIITAASVSASTAAISFAAQTLPILQWLAAFVAVVAGNFAIYKHIRDRKRVSKAT